MIRAAQTLREEEVGILTNAATRRLEARSGIREDPNLGSNGSDDLLTDVNLIRLPLRVVPAIMIAQ